ncbi:hypothetical protein [Cellvibrio sp. PSBB006]|uniref:hypothetical protein n=1 Tax=Cellvibrio sp. PSBB006 TaxID=1987723 RepID=UPI000B3B8270|nr:hypothetical protein [Cellvibrio sp. PSBB006]ARU28484.1 hypothetical protein CBR65_14130 [Cellvibrio sp. PSBB006]
MLDLGSTDFNLSIASVAASQLEVLSNSLFDEWDAYVDQALILPDYSLFLQVEEGSIIGRGHIMAGAKALVIGLTAYGGLMSGVDIVNKQLKSTNRFLAEQAQTIFACPDSRATVRKRGGAPASLQRLFSRVQRGELTPDEATILAQSILGEDESEIPGFFEVLSKAFHECPNLPKQEQLPFDELVEELPIELINKKAPKTPKPRPPNIPALHYRVEVWRESKGNRKQTKVTVL